MIARVFHLMIISHYLVHATFASYFFCFDCSEIFAPATLTTPFLLVFHPSSKWIQWWWSLFRLSLEHAGKLAIAWVGRRGRKGVQVEKLTHNKKSVNGEMALAIFLSFAHTQGQSEKQMRSEWRAKKQMRGGGKWGWGVWGMEREREGSIRSAGCNKTCRSMLDKIWTVGQHQT